MYSVWAGCADYCDDTCTSPQTPPCSLLNEDFRLVTFPRLSLPALLTPLPTKELKALTQGTSQIVPQLLGGLR